MLLIYLPQISPRHQYIFDTIFASEFGIEYQTTTDRHLFESYTEEKINYSDNRFQDEVFIKASSLLMEDGVKEIELQVAEKNGIKILFPNNNLCDVGFDIFSAAFYMLSRYEEYLPFAPDKYGRYKAENCLAYKNNFLQIPIVDRWIEEFKKILQKKLPALTFRSSKFEAIITYDIDVAYKFKGRSFLRNAGSTIKDLLKFDLKNITQRFRTLNKKNKDPWDTYDYLCGTIADNKLQSIFFFLLGDHSTYDRNLDYRNPVVHSLINKIKTFSETGIHPSFKTSLFIEKILLEKQRLEKIAEKKITKSRQHFLKFTLPETYNALINAGITEDYSMGFPYAPGFRAGTSKPFYFYDLKNENETKLKIFPVTLMEGNFANKEYSDKVKIMKAIFTLIDEVKNVNGTFISIWHNHTVSNTDDYRDWRNMHDKMIRALL